MTDTISSINQWQALARPDPTQRDVTIAFAVLLEEVTELLDAIHLGRTGQYARDAVHQLAEAAKRDEFSISVKDRKAYLDGLCDVIVTAVGAGHCAGMKVPMALDRVSESNWSKCVDGRFVRNEQGKITKPDGYHPPNLEGCY